MNWYESKKKSSSSGGGHTILDDTGTALAQESNLQFNGAYAYDDSTNNKTVVNIIRQMSLQDYNQLSLAEKIGLIEVYDEEEYLILNGTLIANTTQLVLTDARITSKMKIDYWTSVFGFNPLSCIVSDGQITMTFNAYNDNVQVEVRLE